MGEPSGSSSGTGGEGRNIIVAIDGSDNSINALEWYVVNLRKDDDRLTLLQVSSKGAGGITMPIDAPMDCPQETFDVIVGRNSDDGYIEELRRSYEGLLKEYDISNNQFKFVNINDSNPGSAICRWVKANGVNHIVIGTRGLGKIKRKLLGSVSDYVIHNSNTSVSIVPNTKNNEKNN